MCTEPGIPSVNSVSAISASPERRSQCPGIVYILALALARGLFHLTRELRAKRRNRGLCLTRACVHMQYGADAANAVFCTFGAGVRRVNLDVLYCTDYRGRRLVQIGFTREMRSVEGDA